jgi:hypothetical protein
MCLQKDTNAAKPRVRPECNEPRLNVVTRWRLKIRVMCQKRKPPECRLGTWLGSENQDDRTLSCWYAKINKPWKDTSLKQVNSVIVHMWGGNILVEIGRQLAGGQWMPTESEEHDINVYSGSGLMSRARYVTEYSINLSNDERHFTHSYPHWRGAWLASYSNRFTPMSGLRSFGLVA